MIRAILVFAVAGCSGGDDDGGARVPVARAVTASGSTNGLGLWRLPVEVESGDQAFLVSADGTSNLSVETLFDPNGEEVLVWQDWDGAESLTSAFLSTYEQTVLNWPVRAEDGPLTPGTWEVEIAATSSSGSYKGDVDIDATVLLKRDPDLSNGRVDLRIVYGAGLEDDDQVVAATEAAVERWREVWAAFGLRLVETYDAAASIDGNVGAGLGDSDIQDAAREGTDTDLMVILVEEIGGDNATYGITGNIPWTTMPFPHAATAISWLAHAGTNGAFEADEISLMGETMAHEVGHYMGLFHPVEDGYKAWDAIGDTAQCTGWLTCDDVLGDNLMYPYPVCSGGDCLAQDVLTEGQQGVTQRYLGAL